MKIPIIILSLLAVGVSAAPLIFSTDLLKHGDHEGRIVALHHVTHHISDTEKLSLLFLVPALHKVAALSKDGFGSAGLDMAAKHHDFLKLIGNDLLVDLIALSDCKSWHAVLLGVWDHVAGVHVHKGFAGVKDAAGKFVLHHHDLTGLVEFIKGKLIADKLKGLFDKGVPAHLFTHTVHRAFAHLL